METSSVFVTPNQVHGLVSSHPFGLAARLLWSQRRSVRPRTPLQLYTILSDSGQTTMQVEIELFLKVSNAQCYVAAEETLSLLSVMQTLYHCHHHSNSLFTTTFRVGCTIWLLDLLHVLRDPAFQILKGDKVSRQVHQMHGGRKHDRTRVMAASSGFCG